MPRPKKSTVTAAKMLPEERALWQAYARQRTPERRNQLCEHYQHLVVAIARRLCERLPNSVELDDMISAGTIGLMGAVQAFEPARGILFGTYATQRIHGQMIDELRLTDHVSRNTRARAARWEHAMSQLRAELQREPTDEEIAVELGGTAEEVTVLRLASVAARQTARLRTGLYRSVEESDRDVSLEWTEIVADPHAAAPDRRQVAGDVWRIVLRGCSKAERLVLIGYYHEEQTMKEIGKSLGMSESRVSQIHSALLDRLRAGNARLRLRDSAPVPSMSRAARRSPIPWPRRASA